MNIRVERQRAFNQYVIMLQITRVFSELVTCCYCNFQLEIDSLITFTA